jgi:hypothetical protein
MATNDNDVRDAALFRLWIKLADETPIRVARALARCTHVEDYRVALTLLAREERINLP